MANEPKLPLMLDTSALIFDFYCAIDRNYKVVREFETIQEAEAFIANANGVDVREFRLQTAKQAELQQEYLRNARRHLASKQPQNSTTTRDEGWSWDTLSDDIKKHFPPPPKKIQYSSTDEYEEAQAFWMGRVGKNISLVLQQRKNRYRSHEQDS